MLVTVWDDNDLKESPTSTYLKLGHKFRPKFKNLFQIYQISAVFKSHETICEKWHEELAKNIAMLDSDLKAFMEKLKSENGKPFNEMSNGIQA